MRRAPRPDVALIDVRMPELDGLTAARQLLAEGPVAPACRFLILATFDVDDYIYEALASRAQRLSARDTRRAAGRGGYPLHHRR